MNILLRKAFNTPLSFKPLQQISVGSYFSNRGLAYQMSSEKISQESFLSEIKSNNNINEVAVYGGFDPTSDCLHLGNFIQILNLVRLGYLGLKPVFLVGGATGIKVIFIL